MSRARNLIVAVGVAALAFGLVVAVEPSFAGVLTTSEFYVSILGIMALLQGYRVIQRRRRSKIVEATTADPELIVPTATPGEDFDREVGRIRDLRRSSIRTRQRLRDRLHASAVATIQRYDHCSHEAARERVEEGTWTDDPFAAAFLGSNASPPPLLARIRHVLTRESRFQRDARRTAEAIVSLHRRGRP